jgi:hypothetical protein
MFNSARTLRPLRPFLRFSTLALLVAWGCGGDDATTTPRGTPSGTTGGAGGGTTTSGPGASTTGTGGSGTTGAGGSGGGNASPAKITTVAIYQGVQINLMKDGAAVSKLNGPIVKNRPALVRVFVQPGSGWAAHDVSASLELTAGPKNQTVNVKAASADADLGSTFNFELSADEMNVDSLSYAVTIHDPTATNDTRWPETGTSTLSPKSSGASIKIVYVPFNYQVGGQSILPDTSPAAIKKLDDALFAEYPTAKIESSVRAAMPYTGPAIQAMGGGWQQAIISLAMLRQQDRPAPNVYYYGLVSPAPTLQGYCPVGCVGGVAAVPMSVTASLQFVAMGVSYTEPFKTVENMEVRVALQEVAHTFGRLHAYCDVPDGGTPPMGLDPNYPYKTGSIGVWGYDVLTKKLYDPAKYDDIQSYCNPVWISDYTYSAIFDWITKVNAATPIIFGSAEPSIDDLNLRYVRF